MGRALRQDVRIHVDGVVSRAHGCGERVSPGARGLGPHVASAASSRAEPPVDSAAFLVLIPRFGGIGYAAALLLGSVVLLLSVVTSSRHEGRAGRLCGETNLKAWTKHLGLMETVRVRRAVDVAHRKGWPYCPVMRVMSSSSLRETQRMHSRSALRRAARCVHPRGLGRAH